MQDIKDLQQKSDLLATDPLQYDSENLDWRIAGAEDNVFRKSCRELLDTAIEPGSFEGKRTLDIGSGVGQLFNWLRNKGVEAIVGIDPAKRNIETSREMYPWMTLVQATLSDFASSSAADFDRVIACMVFEHIEDIGRAFADVDSLLAENGEFYLIIGDKDFHISNDSTLRGPAFVRVEIQRDLGGGSVETKTIRQWEGAESIMYDIFRPVDAIFTAAKEKGFELKVQKQLYGIYDPRHVYIRLLVFQRTSRLVNDMSLQ